MGEFRMPTLGADMDFGTIVEWRVAPGDEVRRGDIVAVVDTEKSTIEVEVFEDGVIEELLVLPGVEVPVGTVLARIASAEKSPAHEAPEHAAPAAAVPAAEAPAEAVPVPAEVAPVSAAAAPVARDGDFVRASPRARREAAVRGVELAALAGSGPGGAVVVEDLGGTPAAAPPAEEPIVPWPAERERPAPRAPTDRAASAREATGALMARSKREIPHYYLASTIELGAAIEWLERWNAERPVDDRLLPAALLLKATALAAREVPVVNGTWEDGFRPSPSVDVGVVVSLRGGGLVAPCVRDADQLALPDLMRALRGVVDRARAGTLRSSDVAGASITVTNLGERGADEVLGVIHPPQVALVGFGRIAGGPWAVGGLLGVRPLVRATLAADHRASSGHEGSRFLAAIDRLLHAPEEL